MSFLTRCTVFGVVWFVASFVPVDQAEAYASCNAITLAGASVGSGVYTIDPVSRTAAGPLPRCRSAATWSGMAAVGRWA